MAKTKKMTIYRRYARRHFHRRKFTLSLAVLAGLASPIGRTISHGMQNGITGEEGGIAELSRTLTGFNPYQSPMKWEPWRLQYGLMPVIAGVIVHKIANIIGLNRMIARAIPIIRI